MAKHVRIKDDNFVTKGILDDVDVIITDAKWAMFDYNGKAAPVAALQLTMKTFNRATATPGAPGWVDGEQEHVQYWTIGNGFVPDPDYNGDRLIVLGDGSDSLSDNCNFHYLYLSLRNCGLPDGAIEASLKPLIGIKGRILNKPIQRKVDKAKANEDKVLVFTTIYELGTGSVPQQQQSKSSAPATQATASTATTTASSASSTAATPASTDEFFNLLTVILAEKEGNELKFTNIKGTILTKLTSVPMADRLKFIEKMLGAPAEVFAERGLTKTNDSVKLG